MPSPGGQISGITDHQHGRAGWARTRVGHPFDLPEGYHAGLRQVDGMPHQPPACKIIKWQLGSLAPSTPTPGPGAGARIGREWP
jgi:hypothetical protein